ESPEESSGFHGSSYVTRKDLRIAAWGFLGLFLTLTPVYCYYKGETDASTCRGNMKAIFGAISGYAEGNDGQLPPAYQRASSDSDEPILYRGRPATWAGFVWGY